MRFPSIPFRHLILVVLAAAALAFAGCRSGIEAGEGPGIKSVADGELNGNVVGSVDSTKDMVLQALVEMGVMDAEQQQNSVLVEINARTLQDVRLEIKISRISDTLTKLRIRAGNGELALPRAIYNRVRERLEIQQYQ